MIHTKEQVYETGASLQELLEQLPTAQFEMPQKSYIVNLDCVTSLTKTKVMLDHTIEIKLARDRIDDFNMKFHKYLRGFCKGVSINNTVNRNKTIFISALNFYFSIRLLKIFYTGYNSFIKIRLLYRFN